MKTRKLIALDMDGTLLMTDKSVHPDTVTDIREAERQGLTFVYCSGRSVPELLLFSEKLPMIRYAVCLSGSVVYDLRERRSLYKQMIPLELVFPIMEAAEETDAMLHFLLEEESVVRADQVTHMADFCRAEFQETFLLTTRSVTDMREEAQKHTCMAKVNLYCHSAADRERAYEKIKHLPLTFVFIEEASLEITAAEVSKASGMRVLADHLGFRMEGCGA